MKTAIFWVLFNVVFSVLGIINVGRGHSIGWVNVVVNGAALGWSIGMLENEIRAWRRRAYVRRLLAQWAEEK